MATVLLTCPEVLLCNIGLTVRDELPDLDGTVERRPHHVRVELRDPADALIAARRLVEECDAEVMSFIASRAAGELIVEEAEPVRSAWAWLCGLADASPLPIVGAFRHFGPKLFVRPQPDEILEQRLPEGEIVLWSVSTNQVVGGNVGMTIGRATTCDLSIARGLLSKRHLRVERRPDGVYMRDLGSTGGFWVNDHRGHPAHPLAPGMVVQLGRPVAFVVVAMRS